MKVVIIEDKMIRARLSRLIRKIAPEYSICGEAESGYDGMKMIERERPDLVVSDIYMPDMNGLMMLARLKEKNIFFHTILLTTCSEFTSAKAAIQLGVSAYLLKPLSVIEFKEALVKIEDERKKAVMPPETLKSLKHIFSGFIFQNLKLDQELENFLQEKYGLAAEEDYTLVPIYLGKEYELCAKKLQRELQAIMESRDELCYQLLEDPAKQFLILVIYHCCDIPKLKHWFQNRILMQFNREKKYHVSIGWIEVRGINKLEEGLKMIQKHMHWNIVLGGDVIISYPNIILVQSVGITYPIELEKQIRQALCMRNVEKAENCIRKFQDYYKKDQLFEPKVIKEHYMRYLLYILNVALELDFTSFKDFRQEKMIEGISKAITETELAWILNNVLDRIAQEELSEGNITIQKIKGLIHENYRITLGEVSRYLNMTPEYLGTLFKNEEGIHFNTYKRNYRVQKAKEILMGTNLKLYEVAEMVGFTDPKYFSRTFKEVTGYLPGEYRKAKL